MFKKILVALDSSNRSDRVFKEAVEQAKNNSSHVLLLHVLSGEEEGSPISLPPSIEGIYWAPDSGFDLDQWKNEWQHYEQACLDQLQRYSKQAMDQGVTTELRQLSGAAGKVICHVAHEWEADLIMIGSRGRRGVAEWVLGSVSNYVLHHARCSVLVVKPPVEPAVSEPTISDEHAVSQADDENTNQEASTHPGMTVSSASQMDSMQP
jgi:nucleotide-binding universal stress UspA family protein